MKNDDFYTDLKSKNEILCVAQDMGYNGEKTGSSWQGECPTHISTNGKCLVIWPSTQSFKCFHCGEKGDVINLVMLFKKLDHRDAVNYLADRVGMPQLGYKNLTPEEKSRREAEYQEKALIENILTEATAWYHSQLDKYPEIKKHLINHYEFSEDIIEELQIGFAPPPTTNNSVSQLATHLSKFSEFQGKLALSGLFSFGSPDGPFFDFFKGRIVFPYWKNGKVVYMTARATNLTPVDPYECYTDKARNVKDKGNPEYIKYKKLRTHDPNDPKRKHISKFIQNDSFMGEDNIRGAGEIIITEGAPDWVSAVDKGFAAISPVTTNFRDEDLEKLELLTRQAKSIYIINDNEENQAGLNGALKTGKYLTKNGRNVFLVELPRPDGVNKIDLNEYFRDYTADNLRDLMKKAKSVLEIMIYKLPNDFLKPTFTTPKNGSM